ncbi:hypothetical protein Mal52_30830 [Symmachiella dynata]|uniref:Uncharacterized protein n=1 Tax=Symmachiella dynata TaxID=2527995 RepID=A0A517ZQ56_9PLAN|nr:hypothetical protein [Symmachiella dynata]QDU44598.1 hypothetical protein Mal52_30830 [Symmachiella dynata]
MEPLIQYQTPDYGEHGPAVEVGVTFLQTLFSESDTILFRPIETWVDSGRKRSRVDYHNTRYRKAEPELLRLNLLYLLRRAAESNLNLFFGVCPRLGDDGRFDLAWQIRTVRVLWSDIDHVTVDEAHERIAKSGLPIPTIIVNSGNGVHLYWLLDEPYLIDDVDDPPAVETEWTKTRDGRNRPRKYILEDGDKVFLDQRQHISRLSVKAEHLQNVLAGIASALDADHTTDLSRLLRLPGSLNRKDQRNGQEPIPTELVKCDATRKCSLSDFEPFIVESPIAKRAKQIVAMPLPHVRKPSPSKVDRLAELIAGSSIAEAGRRSEADFAVCCYAIRNGIAKEDVWAQVESVGKFAEQGRRYFDLTWDNAAYDSQVTKYDELQKRDVTKTLKADAVPQTACADVEGDLEESDPNQSEMRPTIYVDPTTVQVGDTLHEVTDCLIQAGNCFNRTEQLIVINGTQTSSILSAAELAGLLNQHVEFLFVKDEAAEFKPFPSAYANTWLNNHREKTRLPVISLFTRNPVFTEDWRRVAPGFDAPTGIYYAGPPIDIRQGTKHLDHLLSDFCFKSIGDRTNFLGVLLTTLLVPRFIGSKPAVLLNGNQPGLGKSILAQIIATLRDGQPAETATYNPNDEEFEKRLGAIVRRGTTTIIIDNAKGRGRNPRIESACLERSVTDPILSFRLLGQSATIRAENSHIFCITANSPDVSRDLVTRSIVINLYHEGDPKRRGFSIADPEGYAQQYRTELLGELLGMVERWKYDGMPQANVHTRFNKRGWGNIIGGILATCDRQDFLSNADESASELDETRRDFSELISLIANHSQGTWTASQLAQLCGKHGLLVADLGEGSPRSLATKMGTIAGRFVAEPFLHNDGRAVVFQRSTDRKGNIYRVSFENNVPNLSPSAEPLPNLENM